MATEVRSEDLEQPLIRRKLVSARKRVPPPASQRKIRSVPPLMPYGPVSIPSMRPFSRSRAGVVGA